jgi:hypothetical protein
MRTNEERTGGEAEEPIDLMKVSPAMDTDEIIDGVEGVRRAAEGAGKDGVVRDADRLLSVLRATKGSVDMSVFATYPPKPGDFEYRMRYGVLGRSCRPRLAKSKFMFQPPESIVGAVEKLMEGMPGMEEVRLHVASALLRANLHRDGLPISFTTANLVRAARSDGAARENAVSSLVEFAERMGYTVGGKGGRVAGSRLASLGGGAL